MPTFRIHRMKDSARQQFRWAPHVSGKTTVKPRDYEPGDEIEAPNEYAAWATLRDPARENSRPLDVGDLLENEAGKLTICKYVGFEEAQWMVPEAAVQTAAQASV